MLPDDCIAIEGFPGYFVCAEGSVWSTKNHAPRQLKPFKKKSGHLQVALMANGAKRGKSICVHVLVLTAFKGAPPDGLECLHGDGNAANNNIRNLRWGTRLQNVRDSITHGTAPRGETNGSAKLNEATVRQIRAAYCPGAVSLMTVAKRFNVSYTTVHKIINMDTWRHVK